MLIGIDCRLWNQTGVGRYTRNLVLNLLKQDKKNKYILFVRSEDQANLKSQISGKIGNWKLEIVNIPWHSLEEQIEFPRILNKEKLDLMHFPYFSVPYFYKKPYIVTIHDLIVNKFNTGKASTLPIFLYWIKRAGYKFIISNALRNAKKIIVPSIAVKSSILENYKSIHSKKIEVTYEGGLENNFKFQISSLIRQGLRLSSAERPQDKNFKFPEEYFLRVGNFYPHKNVESLLLAFKDFIQRESKIKLVLAGKKDFFYERIEKEIEDLGLINDVLFIENPDDAKLISLYKNAIATIVPSLMEGFSLTAVEAMGAGSPLIVSDIPVHREICKEAAIFFNPKDSDDLTKKMTEILELPDNKRKSLIEKGLVRSNEFSWEKMARQTLDVYESSASAGSA